MKIKDITDFLESKFPLSLQEDFDNCGVQCGDTRQKISGAMVCFEMSEETIEEAIETGCNLVISHHPLILRRGICKIEPTDRIGKMLCKALANNMVLYSMHTNIDSGVNGGNDAFAKLLELEDVRVMCPNNAQMKKLNVFVPQDSAEKLKSALFQIGCGRIGNYSDCCYSMGGIGQFLPLDGAKPTVGKPGTLEQTEELCIQMVFPSYLQRTVIQTIYNNHPYQEPAFEIVSLDNESRNTGLGRIGYLRQEMTVPSFLEFLKSKMDLTVIRYSGDESMKIRKVAICGGGGGGFIDTAISLNADAYVSGDFKYHDFFKCDSGILLADVGHYEGEWFIKNIIYNILKENFANFAVRISEKEKKKVKCF